MTPVDRVKLNWKLGAAKKPLQGRPLIIVGTVRLIKFGREASRRIIRSKRKRRVARRGLETENSDFRDRLAFGKFI